MGGAVHYLAFSPDGKILASSGWEVTAPLWEGRDNAIQLWDAASGKFLRQISSFATVRNLAFSPDGKMIAVLENSIIRLCSIDTGQELSQINGHGTLTCLAFTPDSKSLIIGGYDTTIRQMDLATGKELRRFSETCALFSSGVEEDVIEAVCISSDGKYLAGSQRGSKTVPLWDLATGKILRSFSVEQKGPVCLSFSPNGKTLALMDGAMVRLWDVSTGRPLVQFGGQRRSEPFHRIKPPSLAFTSDGTLLVVTNGEAFDVWDTASGKRRHHVTCNSWIHGVTVSPDGKTIAYGSDIAAPIHLWDSASGKERTLGGGHQDAVYGAAFSRDGQKLITASFDSSVRWWRAATGEEVRQLQGQPEHYAIRAATDGQAVVWIDEKEQTSTVGTPAGAEAYSFQLRRDYYRTFSPDGRLLVLADHPPRRWQIKATAGTPKVPENKPFAVHLCDAATGREIRVFGVLNGSPSRPAWSPDGRFLAVAEASWSEQSEARIHLWEVATGKELPSPRVGVCGIDALAVSPGGRFLVTGAVKVSSMHGGAKSPTRDGEAYNLRLWEVATGKELNRIPMKSPDHSRPIFSPDGRSLAYASEDWVVHLCEVVSGQERHRFAGHRAEITTIAFSSDGKRMVTGSMDTTALVWDLFGQSSSQSGASPELTPEQAEALWADLASVEATRAFDAIGVLLSSPKQTLSLLRRRLHPAQPVPTKQIDHWVADLDNPKFRLREEATRQLEETLELAEPSLRRLLAGQPSPEARRHAEKLIEKRELGKRPELLRSLRAIELMEHIRTPEARQLLKELADGAPGARLTEEARASLDRLARETGLRRE
jgi:WD40 repeat protein